MPASLRGTHLPERRADRGPARRWLSLRDPTRFVAIAFGAGDHRTRTEDRPPPPPLSPGDRLAARAARRRRRAPCSTILASSSCASSATAQQCLAGLARHGRPIQYAHVPEPLALWDVWTTIAANPVAFEAPSAGFALDWRTLQAWRQRGIGFATLTHAAGISSTGDPALDLRLPFDEPYRIPDGTAAAIAQAKAERRAHHRDRHDRGPRARGRRQRRRQACAPATASRTGASRATRRLRVVDAILTGVHQPGESHFELLRAFADDAVLERVTAALAARGYRAHEFGNSMLLERQVPHASHRHDELSVMAC